MAWMQRTRTQVSEDTRVSGYKSQLTQLSADTIVSGHVSQRTQVSENTIVSGHNCQRTRESADTSVRGHNCHGTQVSADTSVSRSLIYACNFVFCWRILNCHCIKLILRNSLICKSRPITIRVNDFKENQVDNPTCYYQRHCFLMEFDNIPSIFLLKLIGLRVGLAYTIHYGAVIYMF